LERAVPWFDAGARPGQPQVVHDKVLTAANAITLARLLGLPVFVWLVLGPGLLAAAFWTLVAVGATDWVDGYVARRFDQVTKLGKVMDPLIDRALLATAGVTLVIAGILPWWILAAIVARDVALLGAAYAMFRGIPDIPVSRTGKFATACLLIGLPGFLLAEIDWFGAGFFGVLAWLYTAAGLVTYYVSAAQYARRAAELREGQDEAP
jgi:cardiolipin synthase (CMP-forming)